MFFKEKDGIVWFLHLTQTNLPCTYYHSIYYCTMYVQHDGNTAVTAHHYLQFAVLDLEPCRLSLLLLALGTCSVYRKNP